MDDVLGFDLSRANVERALDAIADHVFLGETGALARNYQRSGLKIKSGLLFRAITNRAWRGNYVKKDGNAVTVGLDFRTVSYAKWAIEGRGAVVAKPGKFLRFVIDGKVFYRKRVGPAPPRPVYFMTPEADAKADMVAARVLTGDK